MRKSLLRFGLPMLIGLAAGETHATGIEDWNAAAAGNHNWKYWNDSVSPSDIDAPWVATGGANDSGHLAVDLGALSLWGSNPTYWPAYTAASMRGADQDIDLVLNPYLTVNLMGGRDVDLQGGRLYFFVGEWNDSGSEAFYRNTTPLTIMPSGDWGLANVAWAGDVSQWALISATGEASSLEELFQAPQQYGLVLWGSQGQPTGTLHVDDFGAIPTATIPEPSGFALLGLGTLWLMLRGRGKPTALPRRAAFSPPGLYRWSPQRGATLP